VGHLHTHWIVHRDLKTSNLLLSNRGIVQVADFGLARRLGPKAEQLTPVVVTLWYRAPELLLGAKEYTSAIDMWSVGCILAELLLGRPLLPGKSEIDQIDQIFRIFGFPSEFSWPACTKTLTNLSSFSPAKYSHVPPPSVTLRAIFIKRRVELSDSGFDLLLRCLEYDPRKRITAIEALNHAFFRDLPLPKDPAHFPSWPSLKGAKEARPTKLRRETPEAPHVRHN
jgi:cell division cycle 2-like